MSTTEKLKAIATEGKNLKPVDQIKLKLESIQSQLAKAIPATMQKTFTPDRLIRLFWQEGRRNPKLLKCEVETIASGLMTAAQLGIEIGILGQGWLIPFKNNKRGGIYEAQFMIGYKGLIALARRSGEVQSIETHIVYEMDKFDPRLGIKTDPQHIPYMDGDRGKPVAVWGVAHFTDGGYHFEWMTASDVQKIRMKSRSKDDGPWVTDPEQMWRKSLIKRMANYLPLSIEFANAVIVDQAADDGKKAALDGDFVEIEEPEESAPAMIEHMPADQVPSDIKKKSKEPATIRTNADDYCVSFGRYLNKDTGEINDNMAEKVKQEYVPPPTPEQISKRFAAAKDIDVLDADATLISLIHDEEMRRDLTAMYHDKRDKLLS